jgi:VanZ family protein
MKSKKTFYAWTPVIIWCLLIFTLSSIPTPETSQIYWWDFIIKKSAHMVEYGILFFLTYRAVNFNNKKGERLDYLIAFIFGLFYAFSDEIHQSFVSGRHAKLMDIGFDMLGMVIVFTLIQKKIIPPGLVKPASEPK